VWNQLVAGTLLVAGEEEHDLTYLMLQIDSHSFAFANVVVELDFFCFEVVPVRVLFVLSCTLRALFTHGERAVKKA
jgi:hypothetical protein